jgi:hypothetical protein
MLPAKASDALVNAFSEATFAAVNSAEVTQLVDRMGSIKSPRHSTGRICRRHWQRTGSAASHCQTAWHGQQLI